MCIFDDVYLMLVFVRISRVCCGEIVSINNIEVVVTFMRGYFYVNISCKGEYSTKVSIDSNLKIFYLLF